MTDKGKLVAIEYTVFQEDGTKVDTNVGQNPLVFREGESQILPGLEEEIRGMKAGESKRVSLPPERAYGPIEPEAIEKIHAEAVPENARQEGAILVTEDGAGNRRQVRVREVKGDEILIDLNHPLAGQTITFDIRIVNLP